MPIYEYKCEKCKQVFEAIVIGSNPEAPVCDKCGSSQVTRRISAANTLGGSSGKTEAACSPNPLSGFS